MNTIKTLFAIALTAVSSNAFAQSSESVFMKWKLKPNETLSYKTNLEEIDIASHVSFDMNGIFKGMGIDSANDSKMKEVFKELSSITQPSNLLTTLAEKKSSIIDIVMISRPDKTPAKGNAVGTLTEMQKMFSQFSGGVMLRGSIHEDGTIESFYTKSEQKNMIAMMFELPGKPVKQGDTYALTVNLLNTDQSFTCDSSYHKNQVKVLKIENKSGEHVLTLQYDIAEYIKGEFASPMGNGPVKTIMAMGFQALAEFSVEKGKWISYNGIASLSSSGMVTSQTKQRYSLTEEK